MGLGIDSGDSYYFNTLEMSEEIIEPNSIRATGFVCRGKCKKMYETTY